MLLQVLRAESKLHYSGQGTQTNCRHSHCSQYLPLHLKLQTFLLWNTQNPHLWGWVNDTTVWDTLQHTTCGDVEWNYPNATHINSPLISPDTCIYLSFLLLFRQYSTACDQQAAVQLWYTLFCKAWFQHNGLITYFLVLTQSICRMQSARSMCTAGSW